MKENGQTILWRGNIEEYKFHINSMKRMAEMVLDRGIVYELRVKLTTDFGRQQGIAWYWNEQMQAFPLEDIDEINQDHSIANERGYYFLGRYKNP